MNKTFFARFALPILMLVFFTVPFGLRGARMAFSTMKNDVKDWLPADFEETKDLDWFRENDFVMVGVQSMINSSQVVRTGGVAEVRRDRPVLRRRLRPDRRRVVRHGLGRAGGPRAAGR